MLYIKKMCILMVSLILSSAFNCVSAEYKADVNSPQSINKISIDGQSYEVDFKDGELQRELLNMKPLTLTMKQYAKHEFYSKLPFKPVMSKDTTSFIKAGYIYYWDGWNALVLNYIDTDISPYKVAEIGKFRDSDKLVEFIKSKDELSVEIK